MLPRRRRPHAALGGGLRRFLPSTAACVNVSGCCSTMAGTALGRRDFAVALFIFSRRVEAAAV